MTTNSACGCFPFLPLTKLGAWPGGCDVALQVFAVKTWEELASYDDFSGPVTGVKFGKSANFLVRYRERAMVFIFKDLVYVHLLLGGVYLVCFRNCPV